MKVAIVGLGSVGSNLAFCLVQNRSLSKLMLIDSNRAKSESLKMDLMGAFPFLGGKVQSGELKDANEVDIIAITAGVQGAPVGGSLFETNKKVMEEIFKGLKFEKDAKIIVCATPVDKISNVALKLAKLDEKKVIGFGGQLDLNRLKYLIFNDQKDFSKELDVQYVGAHGSSGIPIFSESVSDRAKITQDSKFFFSKFLAGPWPRNFGTATEIAKLISALSQKNETVLNVSHFDKKRGAFLTWPCRINNEGIVAPLELTLNEEQRKELDALS